MSLEFLAGSESVVGYSWFTPLDCIMALEREDSSMKLHYLSAALPLQFTIVPGAISQEILTAEHEPMRLERLTPKGNFVRFVAMNIVPRPGVHDLFIKRPVFPNRVRELSLGAPGSIIHLDGTVKITIFNKALMFHASTRDELTELMTLTADEADYNVDTGEILPYRHVSITFPNVDSR